MFFFLWPFLAGFGVESVSLLVLRFSIFRARSSGSDAQSSCPTACCSCGCKRFLWYVSLDVDLRMLPLADGCPADCLHPVTPNMAVNFGGSEDDRTLGLLPSASGMIYAVGETVSQAVNVSYTTGGPLGTTTNTAVTTFTGTNIDGFLTKLAPNGQPIWTAKLTGAGNESIAAVALSPAQDVVYICGRFSSTTASLQGTTLTNSQSDGTSDAFAAAINATNGKCPLLGCHSSGCVRLLTRPGDWCEGLYIWHAIAYSSADDNCLAIAATATNVVFGGSFGNNNLGAGSAATLQMNGGTAAARTQGTVGWGGGYIARVNPADGRLRVCVAHVCSVGFDWTDSFRRLWVWVVRFGPAFG
jgi:hypothetical protein